MNIRIAAIMVALMFGLVGVTVLATTALSAMGNIDKTEGKSALASKQAFIVGDNYAPTKLKDAAQASMANLVGGSPAAQTATVDIELVSMSLVGVYPDPEVNETSNWHLEVVARKKAASDAGDVEVLVKASAIRIPLDCMADIAAPRKVMLSQDVNGLPIDKKVDFLLPIICTEPSFHDFEFDAFAESTDPEKAEKDLFNNRKKLAERKAFIAYADVATPRKEVWINDILVTPPQTTYDSASEPIIAKMRRNEKMPVKVKEELHNFGPWNPTGRVWTRVHERFTPPEDCQVSMKVGKQFRDTVKDLRMASGYEVLGDDSLGWITVGSEYLAPPGQAMELWATVALPVSQSVYLHEDWSIQCAKPSLHDFHLVTDLEMADDIHVVDPDAHNNHQEVWFQVAVIAFADLGIVDWDVSAAPQEALVSDQVFFPTFKTIRNNGDTVNTPAQFSEPVDANVWKSMVIPEGIEGSVHISEDEAPATIVIERQGQPDEVLPDQPASTVVAVEGPAALSVHFMVLGLEVGVERTITEEFDIHCLEQSAHTIRFHNKIMPKDPHVRDTYPDNDEVWVDHTVECLQPVVLVIDEDSIDNDGPYEDPALKFFTDVEVNDQIAEIGVRAQLPFFAANVGQTINLYTGEVGDEGWFALTIDPPQWATNAAGGIPGYVGDPSSPIQKPPPAHGVGQGLGASDINGDREALLDKIDGVTPLRATGLALLAGANHFAICAVVYDSDVSINYDNPINGSLKGANYGTVAFRVLTVTQVVEGQDYSVSSGTLPKVNIRILDAKKVCKAPSLKPFTKAPDLESSSEPFDVVPPASCQDWRNALGAAAVDGDYLILAGQSFTVYCNDMAGTPSEFLTLTGANYSQYTCGGASPCGTPLAACANSPFLSVRTDYQKVRIDPVTLLVDISDQIFATSTGDLWHSSTTRGCTAYVTSMPYGVAMDCVTDSSMTGVGKIDLTGTPFKVVDPFATGGFNAAGSATFSAGDQVVDLAGGGFCGFETPAPAVPSPYNNAAGCGQPCFRLDLAFLP